MSEVSDVEIVEEGQTSGELADPSEYLADIPSKLTSGVLGLMGFLTAAVVGLLAGNPGVVILGRGMVAMICCAFVGRILGSVGEVCVREFVNRYKSDRPEPTKPQELVDLDLEQRAHHSVMENMKKAA